MLVLASIDDIKTIELREGGPSFSAGTKATRRHVDGDGIRTSGVLNGHQSP
jgi:hypothetical protein